MTREIRAEPLTKAAFAPFGEVIEPMGASFPINAGLCDRFHDLATLDFEGGHAGVSLARSRAAALPHRVALLERHPLGSQLFIGLGHARMLVVVAPDDGGLPGRPRAFLSAEGQGVNYRRNTWHGVLAPLGGPADFLIVDRIGRADAPGDNLEEHRLADPWEIVLP